MKLRFGTGLLLGILVSATAPAASVSDLNAARVPVADRSDIEFARATANALEAVLVKMTGNSATPGTSAGRAVVARAKRLIQQYGYETVSGAGTNTEQLLLRVEFDPNALAAEMRARDIAIWGKERPNTYLSLVLKNGNGERYWPRTMPIQSSVSSGAARGNAVFRSRCRRVKSRPRRRSRVVPRTPNSPAVCSARRMLRNTKRARSVSSANRARDCGRPNGTM